MNHAIHKPLFGKQESQKLIQESRNQAKNLKDSRITSTNIQSCGPLGLYVSMVRSQLLYCTQIWRPHLMKDILNIERVQCRATKYILNDYTSCYKTRLIKLKLLPLMYLFELQPTGYFICYQIYQDTNYSI